jgi:hypothetical protein
VKWLFYVSLYDGFVNDPLVFDQFKEWLNITPVSEAAIKSLSQWLIRVLHQQCSVRQDSDRISRSVQSFLLRWNYLTELMVRDLTLRSAPSFGSFHVLKLFANEFLFWMGERLIIHPEKEVHEMVSHPWLHDQFDDEGDLEDYVVA